MLKSIPGLKTLTLLIMTDKPHYRHEEYEIFDDLTISLSKVLIFI